MRLEPREALSLAKDYVLGDDPLGRMATLLKFVAVALSALFAQFPGTVRLLIFLMGADLVTGIIAAFVKKELSSEVGYQGLARKVVTLILVWVVGIVQSEGRSYLGDIPIAESVAGFYCAIEGLSIIENAGAIGVPVPQVIKDAFERLRGNDPEKAERDRGC